VGFGVFLNTKTTPQKPTFDMSQTDSILGWKRKSCESVITEKWKEIQQTCELLFEVNFNVFFPDELKRTRESTLRSC
jgi:hypothetical protein